jgi:hypothetical protein
VTAVSYVAFTPDPRWLAAGFGPGLIRLAH